MNGLSGSYNLYAVRDALLKYNRSKAMTGSAFKRGVSDAKRASRARIAKGRIEGLERGYALTDINRNIIKKSMMTSDMAYQRNKVTKLMGLAWVVCG
jgi:hypothetical protein